MTRKNVNKISIHTFDNPNKESKEEWEDDIQEFEEILE